MLVNSHHRLGHRASRIAKPTSKFKCKISPLYQGRAHPGLYNQGLDKLSKRQLLTGLTWPVNHGQIISKMRLSWNCKTHRCRATAMAGLSSCRAGVREVWDDPRLTIQAVIWVERGDQNCHENSDTLLCHSLGEAAWPQLQMCHWRCCGTKTRRVCTVRLVARSPTPQSCVGVRCCCVAVLSLLCSKCDPDEML